MGVVIDLSSGGGGDIPSGAKVFDYTAINYTDLTTVVAPTANEGDLAIVYNSQGIWLINRKLKGVYIYQGGTWEYASQELQDKIQDNAVEITALEADVLTNTNNIALKRDLTAQKNSIESDSGDLQLVGDSGSAGNDKYYGTDATGNKGFHNLPSSSGGVQSVTGDGVGGTASDVVMTFPTPSEIGALDLSTYDPNSVGSDAFDYANFLGIFQITGTPQVVSMSSDKDNLGVTSNIVNLTTSSQDRRITGIVAPPAGVNRVICFMNNSSSFRVKFVHQSGSSLANNRIVLRSSAGTRNLLALQVGFAIYNHNINKWYITRIA